MAKRLARHALPPSAAALATVLAQNAAAGLPRYVVAGTVKAAAVVAAGQVAVTGMISAKAMALAEGVVKAMLLSKLKIVSAVLLVVAVLTGFAVGQPETPKALPEIPKTAAAQLC